MAVMKAWTFTARGSPDQVLRLRHDMPQPHPKDLQPDEVIVKVSHAALFKAVARLMQIAPHMNSKPWIPEMEFSGIITAIGNHKNQTPDRRLKVYDPVFGMIPPPPNMKYNGVLAEYIVVPYDRIAHKPSNTTFEEAAGLGGGGTTVIGIAEQANLLKIEETTSTVRIKSTGLGQRVLITGGSTGTGLFMLQLVKELVGPTGHIVTTASPRNRNTVLEFGADEVIDYTSIPNLYSHLSKHYSSTPFDVIIDITGSDPNLYNCCPSYLKPTGSFAFTGNMSKTHSDPGTNAFSQGIWVFSMFRTVMGWAANSMWPVMLGGVPRRCFFHSGQPNKRNLEITRDLVESGIIRCLVDGGRSWDMEDVVGAYAHLTQGKITGKVVVNVGGEGYEIHR